MNNSSIDSTIWQLFAKETNGNYIKRHAWHSDKVEVTDQKWKIIFDHHTEYRTVANNTYEQTYTRVIASFISSGCFRFEIYRKDLLSTIRKVFGAQDVKIGHSTFDKAFIIKSNDEFKIKSLLDISKIREHIENQKTINLAISDQKGIWEEKLPENEFELSFYTEGIISDLERLKEIQQLFIELLNRLEYVESIKPKL